MLRVPFRRLSVHFLILTAIIFVWNCKSTEKSKPEKASYDGIVTSRLGPHFHVDFNTSRSYALCQEKRSNDHARKFLKYVVVRLKDNEIIEQGSFSNGYVKWIDDVSIEVATADKGSMDELKKKKINIISEQL